MGFFNFFKKFKKKGEGRSEKFQAKQREKDGAKRQTDDESPEQQRKGLVHESEAAAAVLISPHVTEKSTRLSDGMVYVFKVKGSATKPQVKRAIAELYQVKVKAVNALNQKPKTRYLRRVKGQKSGFKLAQVTLEAGEKLEFV